MLITVDGYAASGKSTLAKELAKRLGFGFVDAGMMFRAVALGVMQKLDKIEIDFVEDKILLNGEDVSERVRSAEVTSFVAEIGGSPKFRDLVYKLERAKANRDMVFSGRDTGTAVFPEADLKFFVEADIDVRAKRRAKDYNDTISVDKLKEDLIIRDNKDLEYGSLVKPEGAIVLDNSIESIDTIVSKMLSFYLDIVNKSK